MLRRFAAAATCAVLLALVTSPAPLWAEPPCPAPTSTTTDSSSTRFRALLSALIPSVYLKFDATAVRNKRRRSPLAPPDQPRPPLGEWETEADLDHEWEIGVLWDPVRLLRRSRDAARLRADRLRPSPARLESICPSLQGNLPADDGSSFERRLDRAAARQKRRSLDRLFD